MSNNPLGNLLGNLFGQDASQDDYQRFDDRYSQGHHQDLDDREVQQRYRQVLRNAPPELVEDAHAEAFAQLDPQERRQLARQLRQQGQQHHHHFDDPYDRDDDQYDEDPRTLARMAQQAEQRNPNVLDQVFGGQPGPLNNPLVKMAMAGAAALAARRFLGGAGGQSQGGMGGNPLGGLGGLLGGALGGQQNTGFEDRGGGRRGGGGSFGGTEV